MKEETIVQTEDLVEAVNDTVVEETTGRMTVALQRGAEAGAQAAANMLPALGAMMSRTIYRACYYTAYGTTFAAMAVASLIPEDGVLERGFHDGSEAARKAFLARDSATPNADLMA